ncbi:DNA-binding protein [Streptomyces inusitatus]|uniref:Holo-[acyl-carrier-protein] synthase n=1 Tax=Streptomyces inusitatus TaxID=68221 RepID=A0A918QFV2_9ACTN|nr:4'-phosphopantetheinyl transferase superfamily protein [Streptomyces inusitatus]GGZ46622.1 DNA-binding protein [Streptomyces inusitatus]
MWLGVDVLRTDEIARLLERPWFRAWAYAPQELEIAASFGEARAREFLTGRFAAKEAILKALGTGVGAGIVPRQAAVVRTGAGAPLVRLAGPAARRAEELGMAGVTVSITHKRGLVVAAAIGLPRPGPGAGSGPAVTAAEVVRRVHELAALP